MNSKIAQYAGRMIEAGWLLALITVTLFFNVWSNRVFEPDKLTLLRSIALMMLAAWILRFLEGGFEQLKNWKAGLKEPLVAPVVALWIAYIISTIFSHTPRLSVLGSYVRLQGLYTFSAYVMVS